MNTVLLSGQEITPSKIICIGRNYVGHIAELGNQIPEEMVVFNKPNSAITNKLLAFHQETLHYEGEICFLYQNGQFSAVAFGLDLTKRKMQTALKNKGLPWERAKAFDGSVLFSEFIPLNDNSAPLSLTLAINDTLVQSGSVDSMLYKPIDILNNLNSFMTLVDGDIVMTGTPEGVGEIHVSDQFIGRIWQKEQEIISAKWLAS